MTILELREKRNKAWEAAKAFVETKRDKDGLLSEERLAGYLKLKKEARYEGLNSRQIETEKLSSMFAEIGGIKNARKFAKEKNRTKHGYC